MSEPIKLYYIAPREVFWKYMAHTEDRPGSHIQEGHFFDLDGGEICLSVRFHEPRSQDKFEAEPGVTALPIWHFNHAVGKDVAAKLAAHGVQELHTTYQAAMLLKKHHPQFDPRF